MIHRARRRAVDGRRAAATRHATPWRHGMDHKSACLTDGLLRCAAGRTGSLSVGPRTTSTTTRSPSSMAAASPVRPPSRSTPLYRLPPDPFRSPPCAPTGLAGRTLRTVSAWDFASVSAKACDECDNDQKCTGWRTIDNRSATLLTGPIERSHDKCIGGEKWVDPWSGRRYCAVTTVTVPLLRSTRGAAGVTVP